MRTQVSAGVGVWKYSENLSSSGNGITTSVEFSSFLDKSNSYLKVFCVSVYFNVYICMNMSCFYSLKASDITKNSYNFQNISQRGKEHLFEYVV